MRNLVTSTAIQVLTILWLFIQIGKFVEPYFSSLSALIFWILWAALWTIMALALHIIDLRRDSNKPPT